MNFSSSAIIRAYRLFSAQDQALFSGFLIVMPVIVSSIISHYVRQYFEGVFRIELVIILMMYLVIVTCLKYLALQAELLDAATTRQTTAISQTITSLDDIIAKRLHRLHDAYNKYSTLGLVYANELFQVTVASLEHIQILVEELHNVVEMQFGGSLIDPIDFEVTFMTKSYVDHKITIYAYQNRDRRAPVSLLLRKNDPDIYEKKTETARIYAMVKPEMIIVPNTGTSSPTGPEKEYQSLYTGQLERIRSSVIYPILSDSNELLGTLVVHCNKAGFFTNEDKRFWRQLLEIYSKRIAYEKICLDVFLGLDIKSWAGAINHSALKPTC